LFKKIVAALFVGLMVTTMFTTYQSACAAEKLSGGVLRLHILANSDSESDQALKLKVRDAILVYTQELFANAASKEQAQEIARKNLAQMEAVAEQVLRENGCEYKVTAHVEHTYFPTREYGNGQRLPAGFYDALRLEIGAAQGHNWWCILYPSLCLGSSIEPVAGARNFQIKFKIVEWWHAFLALL
jgi:stage II sporulation protein R